MKATMKVDVSGLEDLSRRCQSSSIRNQLESIAGEKAVAALIGQAIGDNFEQNGPGWKPIRRDGRILRDSGDLHRSVTTPGAPGNIYRVDGTVVSWGTNLVYAGIHQKGGTVRVKNAKYLFIPISDKARKVGPQPKGKRSVKLEVGKDVVFKKSVVIPARPYLVLRDFWKRQIYEYFIQRAKQIVMGAVAK